MNRSSQLARLPGLLLLVLVLTCCSALLAAPLPFIDMDGDGFDDNEADGNADGIPDILAPDYVQSQSDDALAGVFATMDVVTAPSMELEQTNAEKFGERKFQCRMLDANRSKFDAGFGSGLGVSAGGGGCAGGICF